MTWSGADPRGDRGRPPRPGSGRRPPARRGPARPGRRPRPDRRAPRARRPSRRSGSGSPRTAGSSNWVSASALATTSPYAQVGWSRRAPRSPRRGRRSGARPGRRASSRSRPRRSPAGRAGRGPPGARPAAGSAAAVIPPQLWPTTARSGRPGRPPRRTPRCRRRCRRTGDDPVHGPVRPWPAWSTATTRRPSPTASAGPIRHQIRDEAVTPWTRSSGGGAGIAPAARRERDPVRLDDAQLGLGRVVEGARDRRRQVDPSAESRRRERPGRAPSRPTVSRRPRGPRQRLESRAQPDRRRSPWPTSSSSS